MSDKLVVLVTCGSEKEALRLARALVKEHLAACVNIHRAPVRSIYRWKGKVEEAQERLLLVKTTRARFRALRDAVASLHSYDVPEIIALPIERGSPRYLAWIGESVIPPEHTHRSGRSKRQR